MKHEVKYEVLLYGGHILAPLGFHPLLQLPWLIDFEFRLVS